MRTPSSTPPRWSSRTRSSSASSPPRGIRHASWKSPGDIPERFLMTTNFREHLIRYGGDDYPEIVEKAQGCYVWDANGTKILDFTSGQMCATVGHNHPNIVSAIRKSCDTALHLFSGMIPRSVVQLAEALAKIVPKPLKKSLLVNTGSESNEAAIKMAKLATGGFE